MGETTTGAPPAVEQPAQIGATEQRSNGATEQRSNGATEQRGSGARDRHEKIPCPECGKLFQRLRGMGRHRRSAHGIAGAHYVRRTPKNPAREPKARTQRKTGSMADLFEAIAAQIREAGAIYDQCVGGLGVVVEAGRELRKKYIVNTDKLKKLQALAREDFKE